MEEVSNSSMASISVPRDEKVAPDHDRNGLPLLQKRKRSTALRVLKVVLYMLRRKSSKPKSKSIQVNEISKFSWKRLLGSMRPMHLQSNQSPPPTNEAKPATTPEPESIPVGQQTDEAIASPLSPIAISISSYGSVGDMSQHESPSNQEIHVLKPSVEECWYDDDGGDEMIDAKAEEFIAHFYQQMRLQNLMN